MGRGRVAWAEMSRKFIAQSRPDIGAQLRQKDKGTQVHVEVT